jgi:hypothetical protein
VATSIDQGARVPYPLHLVPDLPRDGGLYLVAEYLLLWWHHECQLTSHAPVDLANDGRGRVVRFQVAQRFPSVPCVSR